MPYRRFPTTHSPGYRVSDAYIQGSFGSKKGSRWGLRVGLRVDMWESANTSRQVCRSPSWATRLAAISAIFDQWVRLTPLSYFLQVSFRNAPQFALASEGALLPLRYTEPALSPLLALPSNLAPRKPRLGVLPTLIRKAGAKVHLFCQFSKSKNEFNHKFNNYYPIFLYRRPLRGIDRPIGRGRYRAGVLCAPRLLRPHLPA